MSARRRSVAAALVATALWLHPPVATAALRPTLRAWPGPGFRTAEGSYLRALREDVTFTPLLTVGDSLPPPEPEEEETFVFYPAPDGLGLQRVEQGLAELYVSHGFEWDDGLGGGRVSRLLIDPNAIRILSADWIVDGVESFDRLRSATLVGPHEGFLTPRFLINEQSILGPNHGLVAAVDPRSGSVNGLPWLGRGAHTQTMVIPGTAGQIIAILTEDSDPGRSQLYMYVAQTDLDFLNGQGQLYVLRANPPAGTENTQLASMASKSRALTGRFEPVRGFTVRGDANDPAAVELAANAAGCLDFAHLEDAAPDRRNPNAFFVVDKGDANWLDPIRGGPVTGNGRVYRIELDPFDPTVVKEIRVVLDGDVGDDLYRPNDIDTDDFGIMIQEAPGRRGIHPARILRYDFRTLRLDPIAECVEHDAKGRLLPEGTGGVWRSAGIMDASAVLGPGAWLLTVQAPTIRTPAFRGRGGGGQLLLMRTTAWGQVPKRVAKKGAGKGDKDKGAPKKDEGNPDKDTGTKGTETPKGP